MQTLRPILSGLMVALYTALVCGVAGGLLTFWMWGFGALVTMPMGFFAGAVLGWRWPLRDATILLAGCLSTLAAANWIGFALDWRASLDFILPVSLIFLSGLFGWFVKSQLLPRTRYWLAITLIASLLFNGLMIYIIRT